jgi:membrane associated rhomboid family serine protease
MHERYFYLAEMLSIAYGAAFPKRAWVSVVLLFGGFLIYSAYLFGEVPILSMRYVAAIYGLLLGYLLLRFFSRQNTKTLQNIEKSR